MTYVTSRALIAWVAKTIKALTKERGITFISTVDLLCAKGTEKMVEEDLQQPLSPKEMQAKFIETVTEMGAKTKAERLARGEIGPDDILPKPKPPAK